MKAPRFFNSAWVSAPKGLVARNGGFNKQHFCVRWGLYETENHGNIVIDTGYSHRVTRGKSRSLPLKIYNALLRPKLHALGLCETVLSQLKNDISLVILTHFHADHIAAVKDFPNSRFLASRIGFEQFKRASNFSKWRHGHFSELLPDDFEERLCFIEDCKSITINNHHTYDLLGDGSLLALPLPGHDTGHFGLLWPKLSPPLLYAVDVDWLACNLQDKRQSFAMRMVSFNCDEAQLSHAIVKDFIQQGYSLVLCHDPSTNSYDSSNPALIHHYVEKGEA